MLYINFLDYASTNHLLLDRAATTALQMAVAAPAPARIWESGNIHLQI
jgi:hypothetical protein